MQIAGRPDVADLYVYKAYGIVLYCFVYIRILAGFMNIYTIRMTNESTLPATYTLV